MLDYYDQMLIAIAAVMLAGVAASVHPLIEIHQGLAGGSLVATLFLYEILFRNPPTEPTTSTTAAPAVVGSSWLLTLILSL
jgi:hypothetical protein